MMNPGTMSEEIGQTLRSGFEAFKSTPVVFAILLFNVGLLSGVFYLAHLGAERWEKIFEVALKQCGPQQPMRLQSDESHPVELPPLPQPRPPEAQ